MNAEMDISKNQWISTGGKSTYKNDEVTAEKQILE